MIINALAHSIAGFRNLEICMGFPVLESVYHACLLSTQSFWQESSWQRSDVTGLEPVTITVWYITFARIANILKLQKLA